MSRVILWDFDGTLAERPGLWGACLLETLDEEEPGHGISLDALRPLLRHGFPWHTPDVAHPELCEPEQWWQHVSGLLAAVYVAVGLEHERAAALAQFARRRYVDATHAWRLFPDTLGVLEDLRERGWQHVILSNHIPELPALCDGLGLSRLLAGVISSAETGYEKPHPQAFAIARERSGNPDKLWMIGDNPIADVAGAEAAGIPAVLVHRDGGVPQRSRELHDAAAVIIAACTA